MSGSARKGSPYRDPTELGEDEAEAIRVRLMGSEFMAQMKESIRAVIKSYPELSRCRVTLSR